MAQAALAHRHCSLPSTTRFPCLYSPWPQAHTAPKWLDPGAGDTLCAEARRQDADMIVMTAHGYTGLRRLALGSVTDKGRHGTHVPVLVVRKS